ncbi:hypothetical protein [Pseudanabaena sp. CCNP1317]|uniref:hypothetical protein n=1 Tax=Pseudanabaena sp. CCNP1317 TaxID=3110253 RepID=UPI002B1FF01C|nr:hypothetical protein [Pseudanabaena sp. CCNP1317]
MVCLIENFCKRSRSFAGGSTLSVVEGIGRQFCGTGLGVLCCILIDKYQLYLTDTLVKDIYF